MLSASSYTLLKRLVSQVMAALHLIQVEMGINPGTLMAKAARLLGRQRR